MGSEVSRLSEMFRQETGNEPLTDWYAFEAFVEKHYQDNPDEWVAHQNVVEVYEAL